MPRTLSSTKPTSLLGKFLQLLRTATIERLALPDLDGTEIDELILLESHLALPPTPFVAGPKLPLP